MARRTRCATNGASQAIDADGLARADPWCPGEAQDDTADSRRRSVSASSTPRSASASVAAVSSAAARPNSPEAGIGLDESRDRCALFRPAATTSRRWSASCRRAPRRKVNGDEVTYVVNRNINYTNVCYFKCQFCAFSKGKLSENLRGKPYDLEPRRDRMRRCRRGLGARRHRGLHAGWHPPRLHRARPTWRSVRAVKEPFPEHARARLLPAGGLAGSRDPRAWTLARASSTSSSAAGSARCPERPRRFSTTRCGRCCVRQDQYGTMVGGDGTAHAVGFRTTATIMYGHASRTPEHQARHLLRLRELQEIAPAGSPNSYRFPSCTWRRPST